MEKLSQLFLHSNSNFKWKQIVKVFPCCFFASMLFIWWKNDCESFSMFFFCMCVIFLVNISIVVSFFHGRLRACEIFQCVKTYWMFFLIPINAIYIFLKNMFHWITVDRYLLLDSKFIYLISVGEERRRYLMCKVVVRL